MYHENSCIICLRKVNVCNSCILPCGFVSSCIHKRCLQKYKMHYLKESAACARRGEYKGKFRCPHCNVQYSFNTVECLRKELKYYKKKRWEQKNKIFVLNIEKMLVGWLSEKETEYWVKDSGFMTTENFFRCYKIDCRLMRDVVYCIVNQLHRQVNPMNGIRVWNNYGDDESCKHIFCRSHPDKVGERCVEYNFSVVRMGIVQDPSAGDACKDGIVLNCTKRRCTPRHAGLLDGQKFV